MDIPDYIDNSQYKLEDVLRSLILQKSQTNLDIATGFFRIEAWIRLEQELNTLTHLRLLIGRDPAIRPAESAQINLIEYFCQDLKKQLEQEKFKLEYKQQIDRVIAYFQQSNIQVRLFGVTTGEFLHAKAYIFDHYSIVGSSNFTLSGIQRNRELNLVNRIPEVAQNLKQDWFEKLWNDPSVDLNYKPKLIEALNASKFGSKPYTPYQVFLKALYELFKDDFLNLEGDRTNLELASFQQEGFERAIRLIEKHRGCIVADAVGLGKTFIGLRVVEYYLMKLRKPRYVPKALVICPAQLRDLVWNKKLDESGIKATVLSHEEISRQNFNIREYSSYDLVVVDESHNFRNSATNRYGNLQRLISGGRRNKRVLLLTATPINNSIFDLYHQILLLTRGSETYYRDQWIPNLKTYFQGIAKGDAMTNLLFETMVRRSRQDVIRRQLAGEEIRIAGKLIKFPKRQLEQFTYNFEENYTGLYSGIATTIENLNLAPYNIKAFKKRKGKEDETEVKRNQALVALQKALYLKRLESSLLAFRNSINTQQEFQKKFYKILTEHGKLLDSKRYRKLILLSESDDELSDNSVDEIINLLEEINPKDYAIDALRSHIEQDLNALARVIAKLDNIQNSVEKGTDYDLKLVAFKNLLETNIKGQKLLVFSYFKDTAIYLYEQLMQDTNWLAAMGNPVIEIITGATPGKQRGELVRRFAPKANTETTEEYQQLLSRIQPIDILICTDVLSEGQNLQDAGVLVNYDLHWNPVRMIQRAGRIDRLGTEYETLYIYNCFPEEGLEALLGLVSRLQERIATIDREVGLDASVLGETVSEKSLEELYRLKKADTEAEKQAILEELEQASDLVSLDEMRLPLLEFIQQVGHELVEEIPLGIHSTRQLTPDPNNYPDGGIFLAFRAGEDHFWHFYPRIGTNISTDVTHLVTDKRKIFNWIKCKQLDFPPPDALPPVQFDNAIFPVLEGATRNLMEYFKKREASSKLKPQLSGILHKIYETLNQEQLERLENNELDEEIQKRVTKIITNVTLKPFEKDIKKIWESYSKHKTVKALILELDDFFTGQDLYNDYYIEDDKPLKVIQEQDIQLVCYEWFKPL